MYTYFRVRTRVIGNVTYSMCSVIWRFVRKMGDNGRFYGDRRPKIVVQVFFIIRPHLKVTVSSSVSNQLLNTYGLARGFLQHDIINFWSNLAICSKNWRWAGFFHFPAVSLTSRYSGRYQINCYLLAGVTVGFLQHDFVVRPCYCLFSLQIFDGQDRPELTLLTLEQRDLH